MSVFVDSSVWYAAADSGDRSNGRAKALLTMGEPLVTSDHVLLETWLLLRSRLGRSSAEAFWDGIRSGAARLEATTTADLEAAWAIGVAFADQDFSLADRTSFAVMERLGLTRVATFDNDFAVVRLGPRRDRAFTVQT